MTEWRLSLITLPQRWNGPSNELEVSVAVLPRTNPLSPLIDSELPFATAYLRFELRLIQGLERLPSPDDVTLSVPLNVTVPSDRKSLLEQIGHAFPLAADPSTLPPPKPRRENTKVKKFLPVSYRSAFSFRGPRTPDAYTDDTYRCSLTTPPSKPPATRPTEMSWGQVLAAILPQPRLAERVGLVYSGKIVVPADFLVDGGWAFVALAVDSDYAKLAPPEGGSIKYYAARLPALSGALVRPVFSAVAFPVLSVPPPDSYDENFREAEEYDDGFAKVIHCGQPTKGDPLDTSADALAPVEDAGIQLGWDDEQLTIWMNRQIKPEFEQQDSPMTIMGYRVDVRRANASPQAEPAPWTSLARVKGEIEIGTLFKELFEGEHYLRVAPNQLHAQREGDFWLPSYFARWSGKSLVARDEFAGKLTSGASATPSTYKPVGLEAVPLRYGDRYEFRVRCADIAGGGPRSDDHPQNPSPAPIAACAFRRFVPPKQVRLEQPSSTDPHKYRVRRPLLGYPSLVFTGFPDAEAALAADVASAKAEGREFGLPDPDVAMLQISIEVRDPSLDPAAPWRTIHTVTRDFPSDGTAPLEFDLAFQNTPQIEALARPAPAGPIVLPTARDIRLSLSPICRQDENLAYFGSQEVRIGAPVFVFTRAESVTEHALFVENTPARRLQAIFLQPDPHPSGNLEAAQAMAGNQDKAESDVMQRLARHLRLESDGLTLFSRPGRRVVFGCSSRLGHLLGVSRSSVQFTSATELTHQWITVLTLQIARDWTWDGLDDVSFEIIRSVKRLSTGVLETTVAGTIEARGLVSQTVGEGADRTQSDLIFFDAVDPKPPSGEFPSEFEVSYGVHPRFRSPGTVGDPPPSMTVHLPIATTPAQTPRLTSAGLALSPYLRTDDYSSSQPRQRMLWLEFEEPVHNPADAMFARVLAYSPDPLLVAPSLSEPPAPEDHPFGIDPELLRVVYPGQSDDRAGLDAMQRLLPSDSPRHFLLPLPPGLTEHSPELFGFFVYEIRVGHDKGWSTAQGRFGQSLRITGVQHPAPMLPCQVNRMQRGIRAAAPFAIPVLEGRNLLPSLPRTEVWALLYAQVVQVDGGERKNVLLSRKRALFDANAPIGESVNMAHAEWTQPEIEQSLASVALSRSAPLSVLAVEMLPSSFTPKSDPLGSDLGQVRILRASPLVGVPAVCL